MRITNLVRSTLLVFILIPALCLSQEPATTIPKDFYSTPGLNPFEARTSDSFNETISPFNGILHLSNTDVFLPGNGGMDISVVRQYNTSVGEFNALRRVYGYGWDISYGKLVHGAGSLDVSTCSTGAQFFTDTKNNPIFETPDGSNELLVYNDGSMSSATNAILVSKGRYMLACEPVSIGSAENVWAVYAPNGIRYELGFSTGLANVNSKLTTYVTRISDRNGNQIEIDYSSNDFHLVFIKTVKDPADGRIVTFHYKDELTNKIQLLSIDDGTNKDGQLRTWYYHYEDITDYNNAVGALDGFLSYPDFDNFHLLSVTRPDGSQWGYEYFTEEKVPNTIAIYQKWHHLIKEVRYPQGNRITYKYQDVFFGATSIFYEHPHQVIKTKTLHTLGGDRVSTPRKIWDYEFIPGGGALVSDPSVKGDVTIIATPIGQEKYLHYGYDHTVEGDIWKIGLLINKVVSDSSGNGLYSELNTWDGQVISTEAYWNGRGPNFRDSATRAPLLLNRKITQNGAAYQTTLSNYDGFGNPQRKILGGSTVTDTIDTTTTFHIDTDLWIVNQTKNESTLGVGDITREFDIKGNLESINQYGTATSFIYTSEGDLATETNAKNQITNYSDYYRGVPKRIEYPESKIITREVNDTGTVKSETNGRGFMTSYEYDLMNRIVLVDVPVKTDVIIDYSYVNSRLVRTLTRGNFQGITTFNGLMNPVQIEKLDTATTQKITTVTEYDVYGRPTFVTKPTYGSYSWSLMPTDGISTSYDVLGREVLVKNPDSTQRQYCYFQQNCGNGAVGGRTIEILDERGFITTHLYDGYGSPDNIRLREIKAPENIGTLIEYDKLNNVTSILQGEKNSFGELVGNEHKYHYDSRFFRVAEDQPEVGHIVLGRDAIGNLKSWQIKNSLITGSTLPDSEITNYIYDNLNRLKTIDYPSVTPDVTFGYDANDNVESVSNIHSSRVYEYDANDNLRSEAITIENEIYSLTYGYNNLDQLESITYPSNRKVSYGNDAFGRPTSVATYVDQVSYYPGGQIEAMNFSNGVSTGFVLTEREWIKSIQIGSAINTDIVSLGYDYDGKGNVKTITDYAGINTRSMLYDGVDRLDTADGMWGTSVYTYDQEDNMDTRTINGVVDRYLETNNKMQGMLRDGISLLTPNFDVYGNQTESIRHDLTFDDASNLVQAKLRTSSITGLPPNTYKYDGDKHRVYRNNSEGVTHYIYSKGGSVLAEIYPGIDLIKENIYLGSQKIASIKNNDDPVAQILAAGNVLEKTIVTLDGTGSSDPDGTIVNFQWVQKSGVNVALDVLSPGMVQFESPLVSKNETLVFELIVTDNRGDTDRVQVSIVVELTDTDLDGLSDVWELSFLPPDLGRLSSNGDSDEDGITDLNEFLGNTDPTKHNGLETPDGIQVTAGVSDITLSWTPVALANRYAIYWSTEKNTALNHANRLYALSSPFVHDSLPSGQYFYYVIVAESVDGNGVVLGSSGASEVVKAKVGWKIWPQRIKHSDTSSSRPQIEINQQGDVNAIWTGGAGRVVTEPGESYFAAYTQESGWDPSSTINALHPILNSNVRLLDEADGIYAEYYTKTSGWGNRELIFSDAGNTWEIRHSKFNRNGEGLVILYPQYGGLGINPQSLYYSPVSGWGSPQLVQILAANENWFSGEDLHFSDSGLGHLLFYSNNELSVVSYTESLGWHGRVSLGLQGSIASAGSATGYVHALGIHTDPVTPNMYIASSVHFDPATGWSGLIPAIATPFSMDYNLGSHGPGIGIDVNNMGQAVLAIHALSTGQSYIVKDYSPASGWQNEVARPIASSCKYDDKSPDWNDPYPASAIFNNPQLLLNVKISDRGDWSILSDVYSRNPGRAMLVASRYEAQAGWLEDEILHCPLMTIGFGDTAIKVSQAMNDLGSTFVLWAYADEGEAMRDKKVLSNRYELLKGVAPIADAGVDQAVTEGDAVVLDASLSTDADNFIESYHWTQVSGTPVSIANSDLKTITFFAPFVDVDETLDFELRVIDSLGNVATDTISVVVANISSTGLNVVLAADKPGPLTRGDQLALSAQAQGGSGGAYEFLFQVRPGDGTIGHPWVVLQGFGSSNSLIWDTTSYAGEYSVQVVARQIGNEAVEVQSDLIYWVNSANPVVKVDLINNSADTVTEGSLVILASSVQGGSGATVFQYQVANTAVQAGWITLRDFSPLKNLVWNTTGYLGENTIRVRARNSETSDLWVEDSLKVWVNPANAVTSVSLESNLLSPQSSGTTFEFSTSIMGGNGSVEYQFSVQGSGGSDQWVVTQGWSTATTFSWDTTGLNGQHQIQVEARNTGGNAKAVTNQVVYWLAPAATGLSVVLTTDKPGPLLTRGDQLSLTAQAQGGLGGAYEFLFQIRPGGETGSQPWVVLQGFGSSNSLIWDTTSYAGEYSVQLIARQIGNEAAEVKKNLNYWVNSPNPVTQVDLINNSAITVAEGSLVNLTSSVQGGSGAIDYQYQVSNTAVQAGWITLRDFSPLENLAWNTTGYQGENTIRVRARNAGSSDLWMEDSLEVWVNPADAVTSVSLVSNLPSPQMTGTAVEFSASSIGGNGSVEYQFSVKGNGGSDQWVIAQSWSAVPTFSWNTTGLYGKHQIQVEARNTGSSHRAVINQVDYSLNRRWLVLTSPIILVIPLDY